MRVLFFTLFYFLSESFKRNVLCILKKTLKRSILRAPAKAFGLLVKIKKTRNHLVYFYTEPRHDAKIVA